MQRWGTDRSMTFFPLQCIRSMSQADHASENQKIEYHNGQPVMMSGGTPRHNEIATNITAILHQRMKCRTYNSDQMVELATNKFYPDASVACEPRFNENNLLNPKVVVEVFSPTTRQTDRAIKLPAYIDHPSIEQIVFIDPDTPRVEVYTRADHWKIEIATEGEVEIGGEAVSLTEIYQ